MILTLGLSGCEIPVSGSLCVKQSVYLFSQGSCFFYACGSQVTRQDSQWSTVYVYECLNIPEDLVIPVGLILFQ